MNLQRSKQEFEPILAQVAGVPSVPTKTSTPILILEAEVTRAPMNLKRSRQEFEPILAQVADVPSVPTNISTPILILEAEVFFFWSKNINCNEIGISPLV